MTNRERIHYVGLAGAGISALAQHAALTGTRVSGSDRAFDRHQLPIDRAWLTDLGIVIHPQDGSGVDGATRVVTSTAVEAHVPDIIRATALGIPIRHRAQELASVLGGTWSVAIAGTSGKSTVTTMVWEILRAAGKDPGLISGGDAIRLRREGLRGNAWYGHGPVVAEADESDGSLVHHAPAVGTLLNLHRDHMDTAGVLAQYATFASRVRERLVLADAPEFQHLQRPDTLVYGFGPDADLRGTSVCATARGVRLSVRETKIDLPFPGHHNAGNALAACATALAVGVDLDVSAAALAEFAGVARRFETIGVRRGVTVVDDYAHNPTKIAAALEAAQSRAPRVLALFQPHGFGPARFMREELVALMSRTLRPADHLWIGGIFYAGGTVTRDISAEDLAQDIRTAGANASAAEDRTQWPAEVARMAQKDDLVMVMGARDASLGDLARAVLEAL